VRHLFGAHAERWHDANHPRSRRNASAELQHKKDAAQTLQKGRSRVACSNSERCYKKYRRICCGSRSSAQPTALGVWEQANRENFKAMQTIEANIKIPENRIFTLQLPPGISPGLYHFVLIVEDTSLNANLKRRRPIGLAKGQFTVPPSFFEPLPAEILAAFSGETG